MEGPGDESACREILAAWELLQDAGVGRLTACVNAIVMNSYHTEGQWGALRDCEVLQRTLRRKLGARRAQVTDALEGIVADMAVLCDAFESAAASETERELCRALQEQTLFNLALVNELASATTLPAERAQVAVASWQMNCCIDDRLLAEWR